MIPTVHLSRSTHRLLPSVLTLLALAAVLSAQSPPCGTMDHHRVLLARDPAYAAARAAIDAHARWYAASGGGLGGADTVLRIPVVVHVVYNTPAENISDTQIQSQIQALNEDFRRQNANAASTPAAFQGVAADCELEFCLATIDPQSNPTNGITRTQTSVTAFAQNGDPVKFTAQGGRDAWPTSNYLNFWVCNLVPTATGPLLGYAQFPGGPANTDGVVMLSTAFGRVGTVSPPNHLGRTTTHEVGHYLDLSHIWGDNEPNCGDDQVADTPTADNPHYGCQTGIQSCGGTNMVENYMDYSDDACMSLFTQGQKTRMRALFAPGGARASLLNSSAACGTGGSGPWQLNQPGAGLTVNGVLATATSAAITTVNVGTTVTAAFSSNVAGGPFDTMFSFGALVPAGGGAFTTPNGQHVNMSATVPYFFIHSGGAAPLLLPFPGNFGVNVTPQVAGTISVQQVVVTPSHPDGFVLSQGCQLTVL